LESKYVPNSNLLRKRKEKGFTQEELATAVKVTWRHISRMERGHVKSSVMLLARIAKVLDCSIEEILPPESLTNGQPEGDADKE
jgi:transcriptional regulator with XRE-family HTH domain